jgi:hypothetical protein
MDSFRISQERTSLETHVELCQLRWEIFERKVSRLELIGIMLLIEATISLTQTIAGPTLLPLLADLIKGLL